MKPKITWDIEEECWTIHHGELIVRFYQDELSASLSVSGHNMQMSIFQDSITEERGMHFETKE